MKTLTILILLSLNILAVSVEICMWKGDAKAAFSLIMDDFGSPELSPSIVEAGNMAAKRNLQISTAVIVKHVLDDGEKRWKELHHFIAQGHEVVNHSWNHDDPGSTQWDQERDMIRSRDTIEAHLEDTLWQKRVTFFAFPYDGGREEDLQYLRKEGYLGARFTKENPLRINDNSPQYDPFYSDFYTYISKEYLDSTLIPGMLQKGEDTTGIDWWLTYPDKEFAPYDNFTNPIESVELRHIELVLQQRGWGFMEMHSLSSTQLYPNWWSPMSYGKFAALLDRLTLLKESDSLWVDVPSRVASYIVLSNATKLRTSDSLIAFDIENLDDCYCTELTLKVKTEGHSYTFSQQGKPIVSYRKRETYEQTSSAVYIDVDPSQGPVLMRSKGASTLKMNQKEKADLSVKRDNNRLSLQVPYGTEQITIMGVGGQILIRQTVSPLGQSPKINIKHSLAPGTYVLKATGQRLSLTEKFTIP